MNFEVAGLRFGSTQFSGSLDAVGSAVHADGKFAIVCVSQQGFRQLRLAAFDPAQGKFFISSYQQQTVLLLGNELVFEPDLSGPSEYAVPGQSSSTECYYDGQGAYVRLHVQAAPQEWPMLNLATGEVFGYPPDQKAHVFKRWRLGVRADKRVTWLLAVGAELPNWAACPA